MEAEEDHNLPVAAEDLAVGLSENAAEPENETGEAPNSDEGSESAVNGTNSGSVEYNDSGNVRDRI